MIMLNVTTHLTATTAPAVPALLVTATPAKVRHAAEFIR